MDRSYLEPWNEVFHNLQKPWQEIYELNVKAMKEMRFLEVSDLTRSKSPLELMEKQVTYSIENLHHVIDYTKQMSEILRHSMPPIAESVKETTKSNLHRATSLLEPTIFQNVVSKIDSLIPKKSATEASKVNGNFNKNVKKAASKSDTERKQTLSSNKTSKKATTQAKNALKGKSSTNSQVSIKKKPQMPQKLAQKLSNNQEKGVTQSLSPQNIQNKNLSGKGQ